jgi:ABC-type multidrug transport system permease subunit
MQCPECLKEFKNNNSLRVHRWRFHNPTSTYKSKTPASPQTNFETGSNIADSSLAMPIAAATVGIAAASRGDWKKWLILLLVLAALGILLWYLIKLKSEERRHNAG